MKYLQMQGKNVYDNLATEEYIFSNYKDGDILLLWQNYDAIVLGKFQNIYEEINVKAVETAGIPVVRRNTGGGTVFHDKGNLNYSFITDYDMGSFSDYDSFLNPVIKALKAMGVDAEKKNNSDIAIKGKKISGNAQTIKGGRILHHGTLLFDSDLESLGDVLKPGSGIFTSKAVASVRSQVTNISEYLTEDNVNLAELKKHIIRSYFGENEPEILALTDEELSKIADLRKEKYDTWEWNYGRSPRFSLHKEGNIKGNDISAELIVRNGIIKKNAVCVSSDNEEIKQAAEFAEKYLSGTRYSYSVIKQLFLKAMPQELTEKFIACLL